jgi:tRNA pseudouridine32 synthase/23S rRNA pseudouridine746 synthase/23S rRNA pseudouridine1911/1915/1917 synthase
MTIDNAALKGNLRSMDITDCVLFRDNLVIVLNKPTGIPVHAGPKGGESLEDYFGELKFDYKETPKLAHRLDRDTSGCLVLGRNDRALRKLGQLFETGRVEKTYWAIVDDKPPADSGVIDLALKKVKMDKGWSMRLAKKGEAELQTAVTEYKIIQNLKNGGYLVELKPKTGRTHQIRVHLQALGCPIRGDWLYGPKPERPEAGNFPTLHLHARQIILPLYDDKPPINVIAPPAGHMQMEI